ncbi:hypothetical protein ABZ464_08370 [Streptomyces sp. NPDC005820]
MSIDWTALGQVAVVTVFALGLAQAGLGFLACAAVVAYGIHPIVPQFH